MNSKVILFFAIVLACIAVSSANEKEGKKGPKITNKVFFLISKLMENLQEEL